jgi:hypothetical protein
VLAAIVVAVVVVIAIVPRSPRADAPIAAALPVAPPAALLVDVPEHALAPVAPELVVDAGVEARVSKHRATLPPAPSGLFDRREYLKKHCASFKCSAVAKVDASSLGGAALLAWKHDVDACIDACTRSR